MGVKHQMGGIFGQTMLWIPWLLIGLGLAVEMPEYTANEFKSFPVAVLYFQDSPVMLLLDSTSRTVLRSGDEGKSWAPVAGVSSSGISHIKLHPSDKTRVLERIPFLLSKGLHLLGRQRALLLERSGRDLVRIYLFMFVTACAHHIRPSKRSSFFSL